MDEPPYTFRRYLDDLEVLREAASDEDLVAAARRRAGRADPFLERAVRGVRKAGTFSGASYLAADFRKSGAAEAAARFLEPGIAAQAAAQLSSARPAQPPGRSPRTPSTFGERRS